MRAARLRTVVFTAVAAVAAACGSDADDTGEQAAGGVVPPGETTTVTQTAQGPVRLATSDVLTGLDTPWSMAFDRDGKLWVTERPGRVRRQGDAPEEVPGVVEQGESGLHGIAFDREGRRYLYFTSADDNRVVRYDTPGAPPKVIVSGLRKAQIHDGGRLAIGPDGALYVGTGDAAQTELPQDDSSLNGKVLRVDTATGKPSIFSKGHRNVQGLCFAASGRFLSTEHGPDRGDEINELKQGFNGGWPGTTGTGIKNWTPTIAPAGCAVYDADLIPGWKGSLLFVTLKGKDLRRLTFNADGSVAGEEILFDNTFGRLRDVVVAPDGSVYLATSNKDGRGDPLAGDDRIIRIAPAA
ncbi:MAG TPA: PQQ-dependent sugar dehydrogenase [Acidimicrobiia bacterium]|nr:PQQ-dependent sugar dehydrogenase [Acidimicrobiia bacterium]